MNINFFENLVLIFQSHWIMFFTFLIMFTIYALKYDISHESFMVFIFAFGIWFGVLFLGEWFTPLLIIAILIITIVNIVRATR